MFLLLAVPGPAISSGTSENTANKNSSKLPPVMQQMIGLFSPMQTMRLVLKSKPGIDRYADGSI